MSTLDGFGQEPRPLKFVRAPDYKNYGEYQARTAVIHCVGSPRIYSLTRIQDALSTAKLPSTCVDGICQRVYGNKWEVRIDSEENATKFITMTRSLEVRTESGIMECPVTSYHDDLRLIRVFGLGLGLPRDVLQEIFSEYGVFKMAMPEKAKGRYDVYNGNYLVSLKCDDLAKLEDIPDTYHLNLDGEDIELRFMVFDRCHCCHVRSHV